MAILWLAIEGLYSHYVLLSLSVYIITLITIIESLITIIEGEYI